MTGMEGLYSLAQQLDDMLLRMQTPKARAAMSAAFHASPKQLAKAARDLQAKREDVKVAKKKPEKLIPPCKQIGNTRKDLREGEK
jgi:hypothetical protein